MTREQINTHEMMEATNAYLDSQAPVWSTIPIANTYKTTLTEVLLGIRQASQDQEGAKVYLGRSVRDLKHTIATKMDILDDTLEAFADDTKNTELLTRAQNTFTDYFRLSYEPFEVKVLEMLALLDAHVEAMADYGMTTQMIDEVKASFNTFQDMRGKPRAFKIASRIATSTLEVLFAEGDATLKRLDNVLKRFKRSNPSFYTGYQAARLIVND